MNTIFSSEIMGNFLKPFYLLTDGVCELKKSIFGIGYLARNLSVIFIDTKFQNVVALEDAPRKITQLQEFVDDKKIAFPPLLLLHGKIII